METDAELAVRVAARAGELLLDLRASFGPVDPLDRDRMKQLRDRADRASHEMIVEHLGRARPDDAVLSEEGHDGLERDTAERVWIVDPLDGTYEFGEGRSDFAVHVALWVRGEPDRTKLTVGVVDLPGQGTCFSTIDPDQVGGDREPADPVRLVVSRTRPPAIAADEVQLLARFVGAGVQAHDVQVMNVGSVGAKVGELLAGRADVYVHDSGFYEWDVAAPLAVARHHGLAASHLDGSPVEFNRRPPHVADLVIGLPSLVAAITGAKLE